MPRLPEETAGIRREETAGGDLKAHELLSTPRAWTQCAYARDAAGHELAFPGLDDSVPDLAKEKASRSKRAVAWDILGAVYACYSGDERARVLKRLAAKLQGEPPRRCLAEWNDHPARTHAEVLALLKGADV